MIEKYFQNMSACTGYAADLLSVTALQEGKYNIMLSGGRSITPILQAIEVLEDNILKRCYFYLADERMDTDYNRDLLMDGLFRRLLEERRIVQQQLVFPDTRLSPSIAAAAYEAVLPRMHIVFLGVGEDGHVASLFPGHPVQDSVKTVDAVYDSPKPPPRRITVTYRGFPADATIVLLFFGEGKAEAYRRFRAGAGRDTSPAAYFIDHPNLVIVHNQGSPQ